MRIKLDSQYSVFYKLDGKHEFRVRGFSWNRYINTSVPRHITLLLELKELE